MVDREITFSCITQLIKHTGRWSWCLHICFQCQAIQSWPLYLPRSVDYTTMWRHFQNGRPRNRWNHIFLLKLLKHIATRSRCLHMCFQRLTIQWWHYMHLGLLIHCKLNMPEIKNGWEQSETLYYLIAHPVISRINLPWLNAQKYVIICDKVWFITLLTKNINH